MKIALFGGECLYCQLPRIKQGIIQLGHEINYEIPDIIYSNDPQYFDEAIELKNKTNGYLILNILDIPWHLSNVNSILNEWTNRLLQANSITTISHTVKKDLENIINKEIHVILNPVKDVFYDKNIQKDNLFLYVGRANDPNKRINLVYETLNLIENGKNLIKICGTENPMFGNYLGLVTDFELNYLYNTSRFTFLTSKNEGIGLSMIEALICGSIPITCSDNRTGLEFNAKEFISDPSPKAILNKIIELNNNYKYYQMIALEYGNQYMEKFNKTNIAKNILNLYNKS
jgi:glycosyltransferase involved in cell wall biosynthesis